MYDTSFCIFQKVGQLRHFVLGKLSYCLQKPEEAQRRLLRMILIYLRTTGLRMAMDGPGSPTDCYGSSCPTYPGLTTDGPSPLTDGYGLC